MSVTCVRACVRSCARARTSLDAGTCTCACICVFPYHFPDVHLACQPHYPGEALSTQRASATLLPQLHRACRAHAPVAAFHEDGVGRTLHAYQADVDPGLTAVSRAASSCSLVSKIRGVSHNCDCCGRAEISLSRVNYKTLRLFKLCPFHL
jgi:hypothetical protein